MSRTILCAAAALFIAVQAEAQTPALIYACVNNGSGTIHVIAPNATCQTNEIPLVWNTVGPQGPPGAQGPQGAQGAQGAQGPQGPQGPR